MLVSGYLILDSCWKETEIRGDEIGTKVQDGKVNGFIRGAGGRVPHNEDRIPCAAHRVPRTPYRIPCNNDS